MSLNYAKHNDIKLKEHPVFNERWLQDRIAEDTSILGLGDLVLIDRERQQEKAGRLDLLLANMEEDRRYEVELMLGPTDESHIVRCLEYWDIERRRYPGYEHCAVLVAEDITSRFLNVLGLLSGTVPLVAIQLNALQVGDQLLLDFVKVLDQRRLRTDDEVDTKLVTTDRNYWIERSSPKMVELADEVLGIINVDLETPQQLNYNKYYIGLTDGIRSRNFMYFKPRKKFVNLIARVTDIDAWIERLEESGLSATDQRDRLRVTITPSDLRRHIETLTELIEQAKQENLS